MKLWFKNGAWAKRRATIVADRLAPEDIKRVAVIRHAAVGDMVLTRPFLVELRRFFPNAEITLSLVTNYTRGAPLDLVDHVHMAYGRDQRTVPLSQQIRRGRELGRHDLLFDLAATARSFWLCKLTPASLKIGFPYHTLQRPAFYDVAILRSDLRFEAETLLDMLSILGHVHEHPLRFDMGVTPLQRDRPYVVYFPSASTPDKCWPHAHFAELVGRMAEDYPQYEHVVLQGIAEWERIDEIMAPLQGQGNVTGLRLDDFDETVSLVKGADLLVGNDTGIRNIAIACETSTVGIFFSTEPFRYWPRDGGHEAAFCVDASVPAVDQVYALCRKLLA
ncbi:hypothetical protein Tel_02875 [Candidatus Tenderia electrophaga]|jgi:ADP-heptose:LPS heptosyltransferase|uniref:Uncharacterized protein n=1 Tax=Candidatus Tenderia electrophaga TaxID=1748243 RepID=A0A0S2TAM4_9GAMM|nr:hypothetical protein Tel_02875 [Candidatus Tenderia electrophaga]